MNEGVKDRKFLVAIVAKKLWNSVEEFTAGNEPNIRFVLGLDPDGFRNYLLDLVAEACRFIKEEKKNMQ